jgi:hypothetical protein
MKPRDEMIGDELSSPSEQNTHLARKSVIELLKEAPSSKKHNNNRKRSTLSRREKRKRRRQRKGS